MSTILQPAAAVRRLCANHSADIALPWPGQQPRLQLHEPGADDQQLLQGLPSLLEAGVWVFSHIIHDGWMVACKKGFGEASGNWRMNTGEIGVLDPANKDMARP